MGIELQDDPQPERSLFTRSDHYNFVRAGIPAIFLKIGFNKDSPEEKIQAAWLRDRYHAPSDDLSQPMDLEAAAKFTDLEAALVRDIADTAARPRWNGTSFFKRFEKK
jgi:Zn-dependent M28 family amino/carboxypeptidase